MMWWRHSSSIRNLCNGWRWVISFMTLPFRSKRNSLQHTLYRRPDVAYSWSAHYREGKNTLPLLQAKIQFLRHSAHSLVTLLTGLLTCCTRTSFQSCKVNFSVCIWKESILWYMMYLHWMSLVLYHLMKQPWLQLQDCMSKMCHTLPPLGHYHGKFVAHDQSSQGSAKNILMVCETLPMLRT